jgi:hypothetical protein
VQVGRVQKESGEFPHLVWLSGEWTSNVHFAVSRIQSTDVGKSPLAARSLGRSANLAVVSAMHLKRWRDASNRMVNLIHAA